MTLFLRVLQADDKGSALMSAAREGRDATVVDTEQFRQVSGSPFAYWIAPSLRAGFQRFDQFQNHGRTATRGAYTTDDFRFYRLAWEAPHSTTRPPMAKGGKFAPYFSNVDLVLRWDRDGAEAKAFLSDYRAAKGWGDHWSACLNGISYYFRPGLTWSRRTTSRLSVRVLPPGCIFADKGPAAFVEDDGKSALLALCALMNSAAFASFVELQLAAADAAARSYEVGVVQRTPVPEFSTDDRSTLADLVRRAWALKRTLDTTNETSHAFVLPEDLLTRVATYSPPAIEAELADIQRQIDDIAFRLYGIEGADREAIENASRSRAAGASPDGTGPNDDDAASSDASGDADEDEAPAPDGIPALLSWALGVAFGRFDHRLATGERPIPPEPEPFDPLPVRSPGMLPEGDPPFRPTTGVLVDDFGHKDDITGVVLEVLRAVGLFSDEAPRSLVNESLFPLHIKQYSKSRRKAPIYWQLATPSASYSVWLYYHRFTKDTLYQVLHDYVAPKLLHEERALESLRKDFGTSPTSSQRKELATKEDFIEELRAFRDEVARVAPLWSPDLDDGVILNFAPLWRLVPQHRAWQKECKACWDALVAGEYDWAHLAMHLWPERVVPKCATDRSLAIAHGLEDVFWAEDAAGKWKPRPVPTRPVDDLVRERTSAAVKAALQSLLEAPAGASAKKASRARGARGKR